MIAIIPDLHGRLDILQQVLELYPDSHFIFLGDLIDRGPDSAGVVSAVRALVEEGRARLCLGNHEQMMFSAFRAADAQHNIECDEMNLWLFNGGLQTLASYEGKKEQMADDLNWLEQTCEHWVLEGKVLCSHAMRPYPTIVQTWEEGGYEAMNEAQIEELLLSPVHLWGHPGDDLYPLPEGAVASVHGHTPQIDRDGDRYFSRGPRRVLDGQRSGAAHFIDLGGVFETGKFAVAEIHSSGGVARIVEFDVPCVPRGAEESLCPGVTLS